MKIAKRSLSLLLVLMLVLQLVAAALPLAFAEDEGITLTPELSDGLTLSGDPDLTVLGTAEGDSFTFAETKTLTFTVEAGEGWTYCDKYSVYPGTCQVSGNTVTFTYEAVSGQSVSLQTLQRILINATPEKLPTLYITIDGSFSGVNKDDWTEAEFELVAGTKTFESGNTYSGTGEIKGRGNSSWQQPQKPYSLKLESKESLLGIPKTKKYAIVASYSDDALMRNYVTYKSALAMEGFQYVPKCEFVEVYLNNVYSGVYILVERIDIESTKVDIEEATADNLEGGYLIEKDAGDKVDKSEDPWFNAPFQANPNEDLFTLKAPDVEDGMLEYLEAYMQEVHDAIMGKDGVAYTDYVDSSSWADFLVLQELAKNVDGNLKTSCYFVKDPNSDVLRMDAPWDFDLAYGVANWHNGSWSYNDYYDCPTGTGTEDFMVINSSCPWFQTLYSYEEFAQLVHERYTLYRQEMIPGMLDMIQVQAAYLADAAADHCNKWHYYNSFSYGVEDLTNWLEGRVEWLDEQWLMEEEPPVEPEQPPVNPGTEIGLIDENTDIVYTPNSQFPNEEIGNAFDKDYSTKWCAAYTPNYVVFDIQEPANPTRLKVTHAGGATNPEDPLYNTNDFSLQILDPEKLTEDEFLAMTETQQQAVMNDSTNWIKLLEYVANAENVTDDPITTDLNARIYRLHVTDADDNLWGGPDTVRIYEIELFGTRDSGSGSDHVHAFGEWTVTTEPTCTLPGVETRSCECGETETRQVEALGHDYEAVVTAPTCTELGYTTYTCSRCGNSYIADHVEATGHSYEAVVTEPTCTELGYTTYTCSVCGYSYVADYVDPADHSYEAVVTAPTCTEQGYTTYTCSVCGDSYVADYVDPADHSYEAVVTAPTCTEQGYTTYTCSVCGDSYVADYVDATGHSFGEWTVTTAPTCTEPGVETRSCECGETETREVAALGHSFGEWTVTTAPTCTEPGVETRTCQCGETETREIAALGHDFENGECGNCGEEDPDYVEPTEPSVPDTSKPAGENDSADTGDGFNPLWIVALVIALAAVIVLFIFRKRFQK